MSQAIALVRYYGPTDTKGSRLKVTRVGWDENTKSDNPSVFVPYPHAGGNAAMTAIIRSGLFTAYGVEPTEDELTYAGDSGKDGYWIVSNV